MSDEAGEAGLRMATRFAGITSTQQKFSTEATLNHEMWNKLHGPAGRRRVHMWRLEFDISVSV